MQKLIIDTNILVSALIQKSYPYLIVRDCVLNSKVQICISEPIFKEYMEVFERPKFAKYPDFVGKAREMLLEIADRATKYETRIKIELISDADDNRFLELAHTCQADFLITGNLKHFTMKQFHKTRIISPKEYWENYKPF
nr:putative toxin-antitoxin system toxin component, PIN family [Bacteroidota bacterium]